MFTAYRYGVWNYDFGESMKMVPLPKKTENVPHVNRPIAANSAERLPLPSAERPSKFISRNDESDNVNTNSELSEDDEGPPTREKVESFERRLTKHGRAGKFIANPRRVSSPGRSRSNRGSQSKHIPNDRKNSEQRSDLSSSGESDSSSSQIVRSAGVPISNQKSLNSSDSGSSESQSQNSNEPIANSQSPEKVASLNETGTHLNISAPDALPNFKSDSPADDQKSNLNSNQKETPQQAIDSNQSVNQQQPVNASNSNTISAHNSARVASPELNSEQRSNMNIPRQPLLTVKLKDKASNDEDKANT